MKYVLIIIWFSSSGSAIHSVEFDSVDNCEIAKAEVIKSSARGYLATIHPDAYCVPKGGIK